MVQVSLLGRLCAPHCLAIDEHFLPCLEQNEWSFLSPKNGDSLLEVWKRDKNLMRWFHNTCGKWTLPRVRALPVFAAFVSGRAATGGARLNLEARALAAVSGVKVERRGHRGEQYLIPFPTLFMTELSGPSKPARRGCE